MRRSVALLVFLIILGIGAYFLFYSPGFLGKNDPGRQRGKIVDPADAEAEQEVTVFFPNRDYIMTGNEALICMLPVKRMIRHKQGELYFKVLEELRRPPEKEEFSTALREDIQVLGAGKDGTEVYIDFSSKNLHGGSLEETILVEQIVKTMVGLEGVEKVRFLVEGETRESLMGHIGTEEPLTLEDVN